MSKRQLTEEELSSMGLQVTRFATKGKNQIRRKENFPSHQERWKVGRFGGVSKRKDLLQPNKVENNKAIVAMEHGNNVSPQEANMSIDE